MLESESKFEIVKQLADTEKRPPSHLSSTCILIEIGKNPIEIEVRMK
jgi:hypothetical protein